MASESTAHAPEGENDKASSSDNIQLQRIAREILENYSLIPPDEVVPHVVSIRDRTLPWFPLETMRHLHFLNFSFIKHPLYPEVLARLRDPSTKFLDMGCCFGQMIRKLVYDGAPSASLYGVDIESRFFSLGYQLFKDEDKLESKFIQGNIFNMDLTCVQNVDIVHASSFFHLFTRPGQLLAMQKVIAILRPVPGSVVFGLSLGIPEPTEDDLASGGPGTFRHNAETFAELWKEACLPSGSKWRFQTGLDKVRIAKNTHMLGTETKVGRLAFIFTRV